MLFRSHVLSGKGTHRKAIYFNEISSFIERLDSFVEKYSLVLKIISGESELKDLTNTDYDAITAEFAEIISRCESCYQLRYIDANGGERVKVVKREGEVRIVPVEELQNKGMRDYFLETMKLPSGEIYVSPIELNREFGEIEKPLTPVIRFATPVKEKVGMVIMNAYVTDIFGEIGRAWGRDRG